MFVVKALPEFKSWLDGLADVKVRAAVYARMTRAKQGALGDVKPIGAGVSEMRIHLGAGWRIYFVQRGMQLIVLLAGGSKNTQKADIKRAKTLAASLENEGESL